MNRVKDKVAIVTGGANGIGQATCVLLVQEGAKVAITDILDSQGQKLAEEIQSKGGVAQFWHLDISQEAVRLMSKTDALFYAKDNIRVNSVHPGFIWTPLVEDLGRRSPQGVEAYKQHLDSLHPIGHVGEPQDIAYGILYLAADESKFITGSELVIDGGYTAR